MAAEQLGWALSSRPPALTTAALAAGVGDLVAADRRFAALQDQNGMPPLWRRTAGFATLVKIVLEQQVSLDSAAAAFANLEQAIEVEPEAFLTLDDVQLKQIGFSRQKAGYCRGIAGELLAGTLDLAGLAKVSDEAARNRLLDVRGIGPWTADVYLLFALGRPDVWPSGDRALVVSMAESLPLDSVPSYEQADRMAEAWRPWRAVAARMLWHGYLKRRNRSLV